MSKQEHLIPIGTMARINRITSPTLRYYDRIGLLKPKRTDPDTGYRYYSLEQNARLDIISYMKEMGMSISEISEILQKEDLNLIEEILSRKNEQFYKEMETLKIRQDFVRSAIDSIERYRKAPSTGTTSLEYIDQRYIWSIPCSENFYEKDLECYERLLTQLRSALISSDFPQVHSYNTGTSILQKDFTKQRYIADKVFIFADYPLAKRYPNMTVLPSGMYACIYADKYEDELPFAQKLYDYCRDKGYLISGDYICEVLTEFNVFDADRRNMFMRLQVPVTVSE